MAIHWGKGRKRPSGPAPAPSTVGVDTDKFNRLAASALGKDGPAPASAPQARGALPLEPAQPIYVALGKLIEDYPPKPRYPPIADVAKGSGIDAESLPSSLYDFKVVRVDGREQVGDLFDANAYLIRDIGTESMAAVFMGYLDEFGMDFGKTLFLVPGSLINDAYDLATDTRANQRFMGFVEDELVLAFVILDDLDNLPPKAEKFITGDEGFCDMRALIETFRDNAAKVRGR